MPPHRLAFALAIAGAAALTAASSSAQSDNLFGIAPGATDATARSGLPLASNGDVLIEVRSTSFENPANPKGPTGADFIGVGDVASGPLPAPGRVTGCEVIIQDDDASTQESFTLVIVSEDPRLGAPAASPRGNGNGPEVIFRSPSFLLPPGGQGAAAWQMRVSLATPADVIPSGLTEFTPGAGNTSWYYGVGLPANTRFRDGTSVHASTYYGAGSPFPNTGDNPRNGVSTMVQARDVTLGTVIGQSGVPRTHAIWLLTTAATFHHGAAIASSAQVGPDPNFGVAGSYPDSCAGGNSGRIARYGPLGYAGRAGVGDGYAIRIADASRVGAPAFLCLSAGGPGGPGAASGFSGFQLYLPFFRGGFVIGLFNPVCVPIGTIPASGQLVVVLQPPAASLPLCLPSSNRMAGQGAILGGGAVVLTNGASVSF